MSHTQPLIAPTTAAFASQQSIETRDYAYIVVSADNLGSGEDVDIYIKVGNSWKVLTDLGGNVVKLTGSSPAIPALRLDGGPEYGLTKDATAGSCGVWWTPASRLV